MMSMKPCAQFDKRRTATPAISKKPSPRRRAVSFHRAVLRVAVAEIGKHLLVDLGLIFSIRTLADLHQIEILDRVVVVVEFEVAAQRLEIGLLQRGA